MTFSVDISALKLAQKEIETKIKKAENQITQVLTDQILLGFKLEKDPFGQPWEPLSPATIKRKQAKGNTGAGNVKILTDTGQLRNSWTSEIGANFVEIGTPTQYAVYHQNGYGVPQRKMVPSKSDPLPGVWRKRLEHIIVTAIKNK